jgi:UDP-N-acetylglucosamine 2-epimerase (non-hydrolysing)
MELNLAFVFGTRPEIIKLSSLFHACSEKGIPFTCIHTNQHFSPEMDAVFFDELSLKAPDFNLNASSGTPNEQLAVMIHKLDAIFASNHFSHVVVQGDTNSVLAGTLAAKNRGIPVVHVEAGLRSNDWDMPEEGTRVMVDHFASYLFPPTQECADQLTKESVHGEVHVVGNTAVDATLQGVVLAENCDVRQFGVESKEYFLLTLHRPSNVDSAETLSKIITILSDVAKEKQTKFVIPLHPRTKKNLAAFSIELPEEYFIQLSPLGYREFLALQLQAKLVFTDSGGVQEECCTLGIPCITLRENTAAFKHFSYTKSWENPFGDGTSALQILNILKG